MAEMMMLSARRIKVFKQFFIISFFTLTFIVVVPEIVNFYIAWLPPVPDKAKLLSFIWILPLVSFLCAAIAALVFRDGGQESK
jgi:hypothetical protein